MNDNGRGPAFADDSRFDFSVRAGDDHVSFSRPLSPEEVDGVRRQLAAWQVRPQRSQLS